LAGGSDSIHFLFVAASQWGRMQYAPTTNTDEKKCDWYNFHALFPTSVVSVINKTYKTWGKKLK